MKNSGLFIRTSRGRQEFFQVCFFRGRGNPLCLRERVFPLPQAPPLPPARFIQEDVTLRGLDRFPLRQSSPGKKDNQKFTDNFPSVLPLTKIKQEAAVWFEMHSVSSKNIKGPPGGGPFAEISGGRTNRDCSAVPPGSAFSKSIFSLKCFAFQTIRPVVSRKKRGFSAHFGPGGAVPPPRVSPFSKLKRSIYALN